MSIYEELGKVVTAQQLLKTEIAKIHKAIDKALSGQQMPAVQFMVYRIEAERQARLPEAEASKKLLQSRKIKLLNQCKKDFKYNELEVIN